MEASTTINEMLSGNRIIVPDYQRAYSWDTESDKSKTPKQVNVFLSDLENYQKSRSKTPYYFGHFLFEQKEGSSIFGVIDGQQRLTTIVIFLSALFSRLKSIRLLSEEEEVLFENMIKRRSKYIFSTVEYDDQLFRDYVIDQSIVDSNGVETTSADRIVQAFDFFSNCLNCKNEEYLTSMLSIISNASCSTHPVRNESEAIQMFIFQNNRGKKPSHLEIIKAQFMFNIHLYGGEEKDSLIGEIKNRFEKIYKSISSIEDYMNEDDILTYTLRVYFNSLWESNAIERVNKELSSPDNILFIKNFTHSLAKSFDHLCTFLCKDEKNYTEIHSLVALGGIGISIPFIIKAYSFGLHKDEICTLCKMLESLAFRHRVIGTRAEMTSRINDVYQKFLIDNKDIKPIIDRINWLKTTNDWWWAYWNDAELSRSIQGSMNHQIAKYILWKYENFLENQGKGYCSTRFDKIVSPELEHIAPQTPTNGEPLAAGYCEYDEEFVNQYIDCFGNYLLLPKSHNCAVGNKPFEHKRLSYSHSLQQREVRDMTEKDMRWNKDKIEMRKRKIVDFILNNL